jgi:hypothetical protein
MYQWIYSSDPEAVIFRHGAPDKWQYFNFYVTPEISRLKTFALYVNMYSVFISSDDVKSSVLLVNSLRELVSNKYPLKTIIIGYIFYFQVCL